MRIRKSVSNWPIVENEVPTVAPSAQELEAVHAEIDEKLNGLTAKIKTRLDGLKRMLRLPPTGPASDMIGGGIEAIIQSFLIRRRISEENVLEIAGELVTQLEEAVLKELHATAMAAAVIESNPGKLELLLAKEMEESVKNKLIPFFEMLEQAESVEQAQRLIRGLISQVDNAINIVSRFTFTGVKPVHKMHMFDQHANPACSIILKSTASTTDLEMDFTPADDEHAKLARNTAWFPAFIDALTEKEILAYATEPYFDSAMMIMADPKFIFMLPRDPAALRQLLASGNIPQGIDRPVPDAKHMTPEKLYRLLQLPGLKAYIQADADRSPRHFGTNLAIIAEYFCETENAERLNSVTPEDIQKWLEEKFKKHKPSIAVANYQLGRLQGTEFEEAGVFMEQYILDKIEEEHTWAFAALGTTRNNWRSFGSLFILGKFLTTVEDIKNKLTPEQREAIIEFMPSEAILDAIAANPAYENAYSPVEYCSMGVSQIKDGLREERLMRLQTKSPREISNALLIPQGHAILRKLDTWEVHPGFELLDAVAIESHKSARFIELQNRVGAAARRMLQELPNMELLAVRSILRKRQAEASERLVSQLIKEIDGILTSRAADQSLTSVETETLVNIADGSAEADETETVQSLLMQAPGLVLPNGETLQLGRENLDKIAEETALRRHLGTARGGQEIIQFLLSQRQTLHPVSWVMPVGMDEDANIAVAQHFGESPDLPHLLQTASILSTLGIDPSAVFAEIKAQADLADQFARPELAPIGTEWEMAGSDQTGTNLLGPEYEWLSTIMASGRDPNELVTSPTRSAAGQTLMMRLITSEHFLNTAATAAATRQFEDSCSSLHVNFSLPNDMNLDSLASRIFAPIKQVNWLIHGGDKKQHRRAMGRESGWQGPALLDTLGTASRQRKWELRNLQIEPDGSHLGEAEDLQAVVSAGIQRMREITGRPTTTSGKVMAGIFEGFCIAAESLRMDDPGASIKARQLMARTAQAVRDELALPRFERKTGLIVTN